MQDSAAEDAKRSSSSRFTSSFTDWLFRQVGRKDEIGKFARLVKIDQNWPADLVVNDLNNEYLVLRSYVRANMEDSSFLDKIVAFEDAWDEFLLFALNEPLNQEKSIVKYVPVEKTTKSTLSL
jgi:uncharacterized protein YozE (UPF0346 family)